MKQIKWMILLVVIGGLVACNAKKEEAPTAPAEVSEVVFEPVDINGFEDKEFRRFIQNFDDYIRKGFVKMENNEFDSPEGQDQLKRYQKNINTFKDKLQREKEVLSEKEHVHLEKYLDNIFNEIKQKAPEFLNQEN